MRSISRPNGEADPDRHVRSFRQRDSNPLRITVLDLAMRECPGRVQTRDGTTAKTDRRQSSKASIICPDRDRKQFLDLPTTMRSTREVSTLSWNSRFDG